MLVIVGPAGKLDFTARVIHTIRALSWFGAVRKQAVPKYQSGLLHWHLDICMIANWAIWASKHTPNQFEFISYPCPNLS